MELASVRKEATDSAQPVGYVDYEVYKEKRTVCDGYERLVRVLCLSLGIPCMRLLGDNHTYNAIYDLEDERWIFADATWCSGNNYTEDKVKVPGEYIPV